MPLPKLKYIGRHLLISCKSNHIPIQRRKIQVNLCYQWHNPLESTQYVEGLYFFLSKNVTMAMKQFVQRNGLYLAFSVVSTGKTIQEVLILGPQRPLLYRNCFELLQKILAFVLLKLCTSVLTVRTVSNVTNDTLNGYIIEI